jgi:hypothetical protein
MMSVCNQITNPVLNWSCVNYAESYFTAVHLLGRSTFCASQTKECMCCDWPNPDARCPKRFKIPPLVGPPPPPPSSGSTTGRIVGGE